MSFEVRGGILYSYSQIITDILLRYISFLSLIMLGIFLQFGTTSVIILILLQLTSCR